MIESVKDYTFYLMISLFFVSVDQFLEAEFLKSFLLDNQLILIVTIMAISSAANSIVLTKLKELERGSCDGHFDIVLKEVKLSFTEYVFFILLTLLFSILLSVDDLFEHSQYLFLVAMLSIFVASIDSLWDSTKASFILLGFTEQ